MEKYFITLYRGDKAFLEQRVTFIVSRWWLGGISTDSVTELIQLI